MFRCNFSAKNIVCAVCTEKNRQSSNRRSSRRPILSSKASTSKRPQESKQSKASKQASKQANAGKQNAKQNMFFYAGKESDGGFFFRQDYSMVFIVFLLKLHGFSLENPLPIGGSQGIQRRIKGVKGSRGFSMVFSVFLLKLGP